MRIPLLFLITVIVLSLLVDGYIYIMVRRRCVSKVPARLQLVSAVLLYMALIVGVSMPRRSGDDGSLLFIMWVLFGYMTFIMPKLVFVVVDAVALLPVLWHGRRWRWLSLTGGVIAIVRFWPCGGAPLSTGFVSMLGRWILSSHICLPLSMDSR